MTNTGRIDDWRLCSTCGSQIVRQPNGMAKWQAHLKTRKHRTAAAAKRKGEEVRDGGGA